MLRSPSQRQMETARAAVRLLAERCPRLRSLCYWAGTACIAIEELRHRQSFDLDFHTRRALQDVRPILAEIRKAFPGALEVVRAPDEFGSSFQGVIALPGGDKITLEILSNFEDVASRDLVASKTHPGLQRVSLSRYLADKLQCLAERAEARDLVDVLAVLRRHSEMEPSCRRLLARQDAALVTERLLAWTDGEIRRDLAAYSDVRPADACEARDLLLGWLKAGSRGRRTP